MGCFIPTPIRNCEGGIGMHDQSKITRRRALQMAGAVAGLAAGGARGARAQAQPQMQPRIERLAPEFDKIISLGEPIEELASRFGRSLGPAEGPLWWKEGGYLLFTDIHNNRRMKYTPGKGVTVDLEPTNRANGVPTANSKRLTATANRLILAPDERSLQLDLVRLDRDIPAAGCIASREPCPSTSTQRVAAQIPEAIGVR